MDYHVLAIGSTGVGKSSIIKLFTNDNKIKISDSAESTTKDISVYRELNSNRYWIDTVGAEDSDNKLSDEQILNLAQKYIYKSNIKGNKYLKIVWIVHENDKSTPVLQRQAEFIGKFSGKNDNIWKSVIIIVTRPTAMVNVIKNAQGAIESAKKYGYNGKDNLIVQGFTCVEWHKWESKEDKEDILKLDPILKRKMHYYTANEIYSVIGETLSKLPSNVVEFNELKCKTCSIKSDPRFCDDLCHFQLSLYHEESNPQLIHPGGKTQMHLKPIPVEFHPKLNQLCHPQSTELYHTQNKKEKYHEGKTILKHYGGISERVLHINRYHPNFEPTCPRCDSQTMENIYVYNRGAFAWRIYCWSHKGDLDSGIYVYHCLNCCNNNHSRGDTISNWCKGIYCRSCVGDGKCTSCKKSGATQGCTEEKIMEKYYACCGTNAGVSLMQNGCTAFCDKCHRKIKEDGCSERYVCCKENINSKGCEQRYKCCNMDIKSSSQGCSYACCKQKLGNDGCEKKYSCCDYNITNVYDYHNNGNSKDGCLTKYQCCGANAKDTQVFGCKLQWQCCKLMGDDKTIYDPNKCCAKKCKLCNAKWGTGPGCYTKQHDFH